MNRSLSCFLLLTINIVDQTFSLDDLLHEFRERLAFEAGSFTRLKYAERADTQILRCFVLKTFASANWNNGKQVHCQKTLNGI